VSRGGEGAISEGLYRGEPDKWGEVVKTCRVQGEGHCDGARKKSRKRMAGNSRNGTRSWIGALMG